MSTVAQLRALIIKDLLVTKRSKKKLFYELAIPLFILPILIILLVISESKGSKNASLPPLQSLVPLPAVAVSGLNQEQLGLFKDAAELIGIHVVEDPNRTIAFTRFDVHSRRFQYHIVMDSSELDDWIGGEPFFVSITSYQVPGQLDFSVLEQFTVDLILFKLVGSDYGEAKKVNVSRFPQQEFEADVVILFIPMMFVLVVFSTFIPMGLIVKDVMHEKEAEIKTYLLVMGMSRRSYYASHFIFGFLKMVLIMILLSMPVVYLLKPTVGAVYMGLVMVYSAFSVAYALFCATIVKRTSIAVVINVFGIFGLMVLSFFFGNRLDLVTACLSSLSPVSALSYGIKDLELPQRYGSFYALERISYQFNVIHSSIFLILDTIILIIVTLALDANLDNVTFANCWQWLRRKHGQDEETKASQKSIKLNIKDFEPVEGRTNKPDVEVIGLQKKWGTSNNFAVKNTTFQAFPGEITALLGHNGAGKSTTFSCLTGFTTPTAGSITICDSKIPGDLAEARKHIGYCPQGNPLFDRLTCMEHLKLSARLRGVYNGPEECREILSKVGLEEAEDVLGVNLSGGMKRKLCVAMALVGESRVVLFDEPTAGMDPTARRQIGNILEKFKQDRTIILTTHYMDEADSLSDRILIMVKGKVICSGSAEFLKARFGTGFILTVTLMQNIDIDQSAQKTLELVKKFAPQAKFDGNVMPQFRINIPQGSRTSFTKMFEEIEEKQNELAIDAFGLSLNTLEQVFISVGEKAQKNNSDELAAKITANAEEIAEQDEEHNPNFCGQLVALIWRNFLYFYRSKIRLLSPFVILFLGFGLVWWWHSTDRDTKNSHSFGPLPYSQILTDSEDDLKELVWKSLSKCSLKEMPYDWEVFRQKQFDIPPISIGFFNHFKTNETHLLFSTTLVNGPNRLLNIWSNLAFGNGELTNIETKIDAKDTPIFDSLVGIIPYKVTTSVLGLTMSLLLNTVITERVTKFKHQLYLASVKWYTYWIAQFIPELAYFCVLAVAIFVCFVVTENQDFGCSISILPLYILYFTASSMANYVFSFAFGTPTKASVTMNAFHIVIPVVINAADTITVGIVFPFLEYSTPPMIYKAAMHFLSAMFPSLALFKMQVEYDRVCDAETYHSKPEDNENVLNRALLPMYYMSAATIFYLALLAIIELNVFRAIEKKIHVIRLRKLITPTINEESDVAMERRRVSDDNCTEQALMVQDLFKFYSKKKCAVKDLTFGMAPDECFGLLGVNGAGKTTTFDMLTNQAYPTSGEAYILGIDVSRTPAIGYCPQFDTLSGILTGRETLQLLGKLNGFSTVNERVDLVLECVLLEDKQNELVNTYSGGQKRRLSVAVCLMSGSKFLILDEPTAGVDPATRRHIWDLLIAMRTQNKAILLTTHSMEECEALCTRIGFLRAGRLRGIGTSQHLKSLYGNSYILTLVMKNPGKENTRLINEEVKEKFDVPATDSSPEQAALSWTIPKKEGAKWSGMYGEVEKFVEEVNKKHKTEVVNEFYLIQDSLEQVFTRLASQGENSVENEDVSLNQVEPSDVSTPTSSSDVR